MRFAAVILAAGASSRMGRPKMVLPWGDSTVLAHIISEWTALGATQVAVVCPTGQNAVSIELDHFPEIVPIINPTPELGMFNSIQCAARWPGWNDSLTHFVIILGDQPQISRSSLQLLLAQVRANPAKICQLSYGQKPKHPVALPRAIFNPLSTSSALNLRAFLEGFPHLRHLLKTSDDSLDFDLDSPADYELARRRFNVR
jgi:molybdenum cofactor cytidylyltransferase